MFKLAWGTLNDADRARARTRCKFLHLKQVAINVKLRNFALFCLALCLADKNKRLSVFQLSL